MSSTRTPQMTPVISEALRLRRASAEEVLERGARFDVVAQCGLVEPVSHWITSSSSSCVRPFFSTFAT